MTEEETRREKSIINIIGPSKVIYANVMKKWYDEADEKEVPIAVERFEVMAWALAYSYDDEQRLSETKVVGMIALPGYDELTCVDEYDPEIEDETWWIEYGDPGYIMEDGND